MRLSHAATPLDLMAFEPEELQPSLFWVRESNRKAMLAVFNWTTRTRQREVSIPEKRNWQASEIFHVGPMPIAGHMLHFSQPAHSVRLIQLVDRDAPVTVPQLVITGSTASATGESVRLAVEANDASNPLLNYHWTFGDGTTGNGRTVIHAFTHPGTYKVSLKANSIDGPAAEATINVTVQGIINTRFTGKQLR